MRIRMSAMYFTVDFLWFPQQRMNLLCQVLQLLLFVLAPPTAAKREMSGDTPHPGKGLRPLHSLLIYVLAPPTAAMSEGMWGHPTPRQRASPSALPTHRLPRVTDQGRFVPGKGFRAGSPRPCALCTPYSSGSDVASSKLARRNRVNKSCSSM